MNVEELLGKFKLREPSADLKARILLATRNEWKTRGSTVEFRRTLWQVAIGLAASLILAFTGNGINSRLAPLEPGQTTVNVESKVSIDADIGTVSMARLKFPQAWRQPADLKDFIKVHEMVDEELRKGG